MKSLFKKRSLYLLIAISIIAISLVLSKKVNFNFAHKSGDVLDSIHHVKVFYNDAVDHTQGRSITEDGYNIGLKYQCVEFVKRYYYQHYHHKMPDAYGNAKDFFDPSLQDSSMNKKRGLLQFRNGGKHLPKTGDLLVLEGSIFNSYGHVAIVASTSNSQLELIQQNPGPFSSPREKLRITRKEGSIKVENTRLLGWLRMPLPTSIQYG